MDIQSYLDKSERSASTAASDLITAGDELDLDYVIAEALVSLAFSNLALATRRHSRMSAPTPRDRKKTRAYVKRVTPDELQHIADVYNTALENNQPPLQAILADTGLPKATASRRIRSAKDAGLIQ